MRPLTPNPGGTIDPDDLVGRVAESQRLREAVSMAGAHVTGERRMGKTSLLAKLEAELEAAGLTVLRISAETSSLDVFSKRLLGALCEQHLLRQRLAAWEKQIDGSVEVKVGQTGIKLAGTAKRHPDTAVELDLLDLLAPVHGRPGTVLIIDEITVLCRALGPDAAVEFLRALRVERQGRRPIALVLSGSIGLHHALPDTESINDLWPVVVGPLTEAEARELIERLLLGVGIDGDPALVEEIAAATSGIPFYIQAVVDRLRHRPEIHVDDIVERCIVENDWHTEHYVTRIVEYYGAERAAVVRAMLDEFAVAHPDPLGVDDLTTRLSALEPAPTRDELLELLTKLERDHYLDRTAQQDRMSSALLARIWRLHRRLG
jgi:hypothetical protein